MNVDRVSLLTEGRFYKFAWAWSSYYMYLLNSFINTIIAFEAVYGKAKCCVVYRNLIVDKK